MVRAAACALCTEGGHCDHRGPWRKPREDAGHCLRLVKSQDASLILEGLRSSLSLSVLLENLLPSQLLVARRKLELLGLGAQAL